MSIEDKPENNVRSEGRDNLASSPFNPTELMRNFSAVSDLTRNSTNGACSAILGDFTLNTPAAGKPDVARPPVREIQGTIQQAMNDLVPGARTGEQLPTRDQQLPSVKPADKLVAPDAKSLESVVTNGTHMAAEMLRRLMQGNPLELEQSMRAMLSNALSFKPGDVVPPRTGLDRIPIQKPSTSDEQVPREKPIEKPGLVPEGKPEQDRVRPQPKPEGQPLVEAKPDSKSDPRPADNGARLADRTGTRGDQQVAAIHSSHEAGTQEQVLDLARNGRLVDRNGGLTPEAQRAINGYLHANADGLGAQLFDRYEWRAEDLSTYLSQNGQNVQLEFHRREPGTHNFIVRVNGRSAGRFHLGNADGEGIAPYSGH